jgi:phosphatidylinositol glycan class B
MHTMAAPVPASSPPSPPTPFVAPLPEETDGASRGVPWRDVLLLALVPALDAVLRLGRLHPDEVFQSLEPALWRAFGFGRLAWEWQVGLRNWAVPGLFAGLLNAAAAIGINDAQARRAVLELPQLALNAAMLGAAYRLARRRVDAGPARFALWLVGLYPLWVWFAGRTLGESISAAFLVWGLERLDAATERRGTPAAFVGGLLLGAAEVARYGSAAIILPALVVLLLQRRFRVLGLTVAGGLLVALALGVLDRLTWGTTLPSPRFGGWWHSLFEYLHFNVFSGLAAQQFGSDPWYSYLPCLHAAPWSVIGLALWRTRPSARVWLFVLPALAYAVTLSATPHKEPRFLYPALVLVAVAAAPAFAEWALSLRNQGPAWMRAFAAACLIGTAVFFVARTPYDVLRPEQFQLTLRAGREGNGLVLMNEGLWGSGGNFYLGRDLPWCWCDTPQEGCFAAAARDPRLDRAIYFEDSSNPRRNEDSLHAFESIGFHRVEKRGRAWYLARPSARPTGQPPTPNQR